MHPVSMLGALVRRAMYGDGGETFREAHDVDRPVFFFLALRRVVEQRKDELFFSNIHPPSVIPGKEPFIV